MELNKIWDFLLRDPRETKGVVQFFLAFAFFSFVFFAFLLEDRA